MHFVVAWDISAKGDRWTAINNDLKSVIDKYSWARPLTTYYIGGRGSGGAGQACKHAKMTHNVLISLGIHFEIYLSNNEISGLRINFHSLVGRIKGNMEENISSMLGALVWIIIAPFMIWNPEKCITSIGKIYQKFGRHVSPFHKDENFEFRSLTAILTRIIAVILLVISLVGFYLNLMEMIHRQ